MTEETTTSDDGTNGSDGGIVITDNPLEANGGSEEDDGAVEAQPQSEEPNQGGSVENTDAEIPDEEVVDSSVTTAADRIAESNVQTEQDAAANDDTDTGVDETRPQEGQNSDEDESSGVSNAENEGDAQGPNQHSEKDPEEQVSGTEPPQTDAETAGEAADGGSQSQEEEVGVHTEAPTGADPDGTVDVATGSTEKAESSPEVDGNSDAEPTGDTSTQGSQASGETDSPNELGGESAVHEAVSDEPASGTPEKLRFSAEAGELRTFFNQASVLVDECKLQATREGLLIRAVDAANVGMVDVSFTTNLCEAFVATRGVIGLNLDRVEDVLKLANASDIVEFEFDQQTRKMEIRNNGLDYTLSTIDPKSIREEPEIPDLELTVESVLTVDAMKRGLKAASMVSEHVTIQSEAASSSEEVVIEAEGDTDTVELEINGDDIVDYQAGNAPDNTVESMFSLDYLKSMKKAFPTGSDTEPLDIRFGSEFPINVVYSQEAIRTEYMLAPRIQGD